MKAMQTVAANTVEMVELPKPVPGNGEVLVRMQSVGICASDSQVFHGKHKYAKFPLVQGHEGVGIVEAVGPGVTHVSPGAAVNIQQQLACGTCYACRKGRHNVCLNLKGIGILADGLFSEYFLSPAWNAIPLPAGFSRDKGMLCEPASVGVNSARVGGVKPGERAVVIGSGIIGNFTAQAAKAMGAREVLITDIADAKLEIAKRNGIDHCVNTRGVSLKDAIATAFHGEPADVIFDCAGAPATIMDAINNAINSSRVVIVANFKEPVTFDIPVFQRREVAILSVMGTVKDSTIGAIDYLADDRIRIDGIVSKRFPLAQMAEAYKYIDDNPATVMKVAIDIG